MDGVSGVGKKVAEEVLAPSQKGDGNGVNFKDALKDAIRKVNRLQKEADKTIEEFSLGRLPLHKTMIAIEKANLSFQLMVQIRNKILAAYEEIMRTQV